MSEQPVVYVSSTFKDLEQERERVLRVIAAQEVAARAMENYGASDGSALQKCIADVENADIYVGLVGWKYGFVPKDSTVSITEAEFDAATRVGIPRLMYFLDEGTRPESCLDADPVLGFRQRVSEQNLIRKTFKTEADLATFVTSDLIREVELWTARRLPEQVLLPFLCDREPQTQAIADEFAVRAEARPVVCVLHGAGNQCPLRFVDCLDRVHLPECLGVSRGTSRAYEIPWPQATGADVPRAIRLALARRFGVDLRCPPKELEAAVRERLEDHPGPVLLYFVGPAAKFDAVGLGQVRAIAEYFAAWPQSKPELIVICLSYPAAKEQVAKRVTALVSQLDAAGGVRVLPALGSISEDDATAWTRRAELARIALERNLEVGITHIYEACEEMPMEELAPKLQGLLARRP